MVYKGKGKAKLNPIFNTKNSKSSNSSLEEFDESNESNTSHHKIINKKYKEEKKSPRDFSPNGRAAVTPDKYICSTCNKSFPTPQALGGHRSSHTKFKVRVYNTIDRYQSSNGAASYVKEGQKPMPSNNWK
ncbi:Tapetum-specific zinc finger protein 1 [Abeliophyllum distichum]|uniref:Tapetum-specific zinc finger protein 1 n=1 Tax=Abeliophyllum distichum TaxID=126358 RepID=A0ABD1UFT2_9LAMI